MLGRLLEKLQMSEPERKGPSRQLACAVLLLECARADFDSSDVEIAMVRRLLREHFALPADEIEALLGDAGRAATRAVSMHEYVTRINREYTPDERRRLIGMLWRVAYADGHLDPQEEALLRRIADLLYVPHAVFVQEKLGAMPGR